MKPPPKTACGLIPQAVGGGALPLPSAKCKIHYRFPLPSRETLVALLSLGGAEEPYLTAVADGYAPREFALDATWLWKLRDSYYSLAFHAVMTYIGHGKEVPPSQIAVLLLESITPENRFDRNLERSLNEVRWVTCPCAAGSFLWPSSIPEEVPSKELLNVMRLYVLQTLWIANPMLLACDFGACLDAFNDENLARLQEMIAVSDIPEKSHFMQGAPELSDEVRRLLGLLRGGPQSCRELVAAMGMKRGLFLKKALTPAEAHGLIEKTEPGSSPKQKYRLTDAGGGVGGKPGSKDGRDRKRYNRPQRTRKTGYSSSERHSAAGADHFSRGRMRPRAAGAIPSM